MKFESYLLYGVFVLRRQCITADDHKSLNYNKKLPANQHS